MATSRIADSVGRVLGDRYRLTRPLGTGASAHVYVAEDVTLRRRVAIKLLHPGLASDEAFGRRFRAEAQVVAALRHPNILRVYDWGEDDGVPYLVMELLEGGSLRALLDRGYLLSPAQTAAIGASAARALDYAHRRGLVHRDIKPANLIFDDEGRLTVADFGLARALAEATWTEPAGSVVGTARYAAPEQVRGESLDSRADVYSLALVLIEATTGRVPFAADTTLATLMARLERPIPVPDGLGPLGPVLEAAGTIDPSERLDALTLAGALDGVAARFPPPAPLPLAAPTADNAVELDNSPTDYPGRPRLFDGALEDSGGPAAAADGTGPYGTRPDGTGRYDTRPDGTGRYDTGPEQARRPPAQPRLQDQPAVEAPTPPLGGRRRGRRAAKWITVVLAVALLLAGGAAAAIEATGVLTPTHRVPTLIGGTETAAAARLRPLHLHLVVSAHSYDARATAGLVIAQRPSSGTLKQGATITVTVSLGPAPVAVPARLSGLSERGAAAVLGALGLKAGTITQASSMTVPAGDVISSSPDAGTLLPGQAVALVVSTGKPQVAVPALTGTAGDSFAAARSALAAVHLIAVESPQYSFTVPKGEVMSTSPGPNQIVTVGTQVTVVVSKGPHLVQIPSVVLQESVGAAEQALADDGFEVSGVTGNPINAVTGTNPAIGSLADFGSAVQLITN